MSEDEGRLYDSYLESQYESKTELESDYHHTCKLPGIYCGICDTVDCSNGFTAIGEEEKNIGEE